MKSLTLYKDKSETLKFKLQVDGVSINETSSRLCLEFENGNNVYFKGNVQSDGNCSITVPPLKMFEGKGIAKIECVAESTFFNLTTLPFEVKQKVNVVIQEEVEEIKEDFTPKVQFEFITESEEQEKKEVIKPKEKKVKKEFNNGFETFKTFIND